MRQLLRIVPLIDGGGLQRTQGTRVLTPDGVEIHGIVSIEITGTVNNIWRATIQCHVVPPADLKVLADVVPAKPIVSMRTGVPARWWQRLLIRMAGGVVDSTDLRSHAKTHRKGW